MREQRVMRTPAWSSVLYLNTAAECAVRGSDDDAAAPLGATMVTEQRFDANAGCGAPEPSRRDVLAWPTPGALLVFDGALAHGVLDSAGAGVRRTLLVNWWRAQPRAVRRATADEYTAQHKLAPPLPGDTGDGDAPPAVSVPVPVCELLSERECAEGPVSLEAALERRGCGPRRTPVVAVHHPDAVVWQVEMQEADEDGERQGEGGAEGGGPLIAALIPDELAAEGSDSESGSSSSEGGGE